MLREEYFHEVIKVIEELDGYNWSSEPIMKMLPGNLYEVLDYYDTELKCFNNYQLYLGFVHYNYYSFLDENEQILLTDYGIVFYVQNIASSKFKKLLYMSSKEFNTLLMVSGNDTEGFTLPEVMRKITEDDIKIDNFFN